MLEEKPSRKGRPEDVNGKIADSLMEKIIVSRISRKSHIFRLHILESRVDKEGRVGERGHRWMGMPHNGLTTDHADAFSKRAVLNKCNSYILDYVYTRSVLLSHFLVYLSFIRSNGGVYLLHYLLSQVYIFYKILMHGDSVSV